LGRALVRHPAVVILDEPLSSLDVPARLQMREQILRLHKRLRLAMIYVTHDQGEAMAVGDRIAVLRQGVIQQVAAPLEIYRRPASQFVAGFLGSPRMNFWRGLLLRRDGRIWFHGPADGTGGGAELRLEIPGPAADLIEPHLGRPVILGVRAEHVVCQERSSGGAASLAGIVETTEFTGANTWVSLRLEDVSPASSSGRAGDLRALRMVARSAGQATWALGQKVAVDVDLTQAHFFDPETGARIGPG
jgi:multiple sugar transport system ATP-binding protein